MNEGNHPSPRTRVAICDDRSDVRLLLTSLFTGDDRIELVGEARDGDEAIELVADRRPDVLVLDKRMPRLDGIAALPRIREASPATQVVVYTSDGTPGVEEQAIAAGASAVVPKTAPLDDLVDALLEAAA
jgi:DNA-binding NarL/FixJ family response regulator